MTYVVEGSLTHEDSMGNKGVVERGGLQYMSAGRGVQHSEFNHGLEPLRFIQCWVTPSQHGVTPKCVSGLRTDERDAFYIHSCIGFFLNVNIYLTSLYQSTVSISDMASSTVTLLDG